MTNLHELARRYRLTGLYLGCVLYGAYVATVFQVVGVFR